MSIFKRKNKPNNVRLITRVFDGIPHITKQTEVLLSMLDEKLEVKIISLKAVPFHINYSQITHIEYLSEKEISAKGEVIDGCAVIGDLLLGDIGNTVTGVSGVCDKNKLRYNVYFIINYKSSDNEAKVVSFMDYNRGIITEQFIEELREKTGITNYLEINSATL